jgi:hypothetical protein
MITLGTNMESQVTDYLVHDTLGSNMESQVTDYLVHDTIGD